MKADMAIVNAGQMLTLRGSSRPRRGAEMRDLGIVEDAYLASRDGLVVDVGRQAEFRSRVELTRDALVVDACGGVVSPGFVDPHTHMVFAGWREREFGQRLAGASYLEILKAGGGIISTVGHTRGATEELLRDLVLDRLDTALSWGTTTTEAKSGYGLSTESEMKSLRALSAASAVHPVEVVSTFMGAHAVPPEFEGNAPGYVDMLVNESLPAVARSGLASYVDVFCEEGVFDVEQSRRILARAKDLGMGIKVHADELSSLGGAELAAEMGAVSAEHLLMASEEGLAAMREAGCVAVLLPVVPFFLGKDRYAPARKMIDMGLPVALATDFNPGTSTVQGLPLVMTVAMTRMKMTPEECFTATTINSAHAIGVSGRVGSLEPGKSTDAVVFSARDYREIPYRFGANLARWVIKKGRMVAGCGFVARRETDEGSTGGFMERG